MARTNTKSGGSEVRSMILKKILSDGCHLGLLFLSSYGQNIILDDFDSIHLLLLVALVAFWCVVTTDSLGRIRDDKQGADDSGRKVVSWRGASNKIKEG
jgi:hypothetical protein